jgi:uncharacterized protein
MAKILLLALVLFVVYWILRGYRRRVDRDPARPPAAGGEDMVKCSQCGVHLPRSESVTTRGYFYCSAEHRRQHEEEGRRS